MSLFKAESWSWVLDPPRDTLTQEGLTELSPPTLWISLLSAFISYALAETYMAQPLHPAVQPPTPWTFLGLNFFLPVSAFFLLLCGMYQILHLIENQPVPFLPWLSIGIVAVIPLHLLLPLALLCRPFGVGGFLLYSLAELGIWTAIVRRWAWGVQTVYEKPLWVAYLLVLSPLLIACVGILLCSALLLAVASLLLLGSLA